MEKAARDIVTEYLDHLNAHETDEALACLASDFTLAFAGSEFVMDRDQAADALAWDAGAAGRLDWTIVDEMETAVTVEGSETNELLELIDVGPVGFRSVYIMDDDGLITHQLHETQWGERTLDQGMAPLIAWAREERPRELAEIYPEGRMVYSGPVAERWVALAREWKREG